MPHPARQRNTSEIQSHRRHTGYRRTYARTEPPNTGRRDRDDAAPRRSSRSTQQQIQSTQARNQYTTPLLKYAHLITARNHLEEEMRRAGLIYPNGKSWLYDTERVKINDVIFFAHVEFCKDNNVLVDQEHNWLPVTGGFLLFKWRWAVVIEVYRANLKLRILTTFSRTSMSAKRRQRIYDEITGKWESALRDYVHVVAVDNTSESVDQPGCFENDMRVRWEASYDILPSSKKDSFMNLNAEYLMLDGTPLQIRGWIVTEDIVQHGTSRNGRA